MVRSSDVSWSDTRRTLRKDHRWESGSLLEREEKEKLFNEHIEALTKKKREHFRQLLDETCAITLTSTWKEVKKIIKEDPRCIKFSSSDRKKQREFEEYIRDKYITAKADFRTLLKETKFITYRSKKLIQESDQHLKDVEKILQNDKRYLVLDCVPEERRKLIMAYVDDLDRRGPPPLPQHQSPLDDPQNNSKYPSMGSLLIENACMSQIFRFLLLCALVNLLQNHLRNRRRSDCGQSLNRTL